MDSSYDFTLPGQVISSESPPTHTATMPRPESASSASRMIPSVLSREGSSVLSREGSPVSRVIPSVSREGSSVLSRVIPSLSREGSSVSFEGSVVDGERDVPTSPSEHDMNLDLAVQGISDCIERLNTYMVRMGTGWFQETDTHDMLQDIGSVLGGDLAELITFDTSQREFAFDSLIRLGEIVDRANVHAMIGDYLIRRGPTLSERLRGAVPVRVRFAFSEAIWNFRITVNDARIRLEEWAMFFTNPNLEEPFDVYLDED